MHRERKEKARKSSKSMKKTLNKIIDCNEVDMIMGTTNDGVSNIKKTRSSNNNNNVDNDNANNNIHLENGRLQYVPKIKEIYQSSHNNNNNNNNNLVFNIDDLLQIPELATLSENKININKYETQIKDYFQIPSSDLSIYDALKEMEKKYGFPIHLLVCIKKELCKRDPKDFTLFLQILHLMNHDMIPPENFVNMISPLFQDKQLLYKLRVILHVPIHYSQSIPCYPPFLHDLTASKENICDTILPNNINININNNNNNNNNNYNHNDNNNDSNNNNNNYYSNTHVHTNDVAVTNINDNNKRRKELNQRNLLLFAQIHCILNPIQIVAKN